MEALKMIPYLALILAISGIIVGAAVITVGQFGETVDTCWNSSWVVHSSGDYCVNNTGTLHSSEGPGGLNFSTAYYSIYQANQGNAELAEQFPTVGIISVMVIIISVIAMVFVYLKFFQ